jgi:multiple sugar transport system substrate-binding protein
VDSRLIKRALTALVVALSLSLAAGCGSSVGGSSGSGTGTISLWARDSDQSFIKSIVDTYNASQKDVQIKLTIIPAANFVQKFGAAAATGSAPDVAAIDLVYVPYFALKGTLEDLTTRSKELNYMDKLTPSHLRLGKYQDKLYALPFSAEASVLYYNKDLFTKAGLDANKPPKTYDEVKTAAQKIRALGKDYYGYYFSGACGGCLIFTAMPYLWAAGGDLLQGDGANAKPTIASSPGVKEGLAFFKDMWDSGVVLAAAKSDSGANFNGPFQSGKVGMYGAGAFAVGTLAADKKLNFGITPLPGKTAGQTGSFAGGDEIAIPSGSKNKDAAWKFIKWATDVEAQTALGKLGPVPVRTDVASGTYAKQSPYNVLLAKEMTEGKTVYSTHYNDLINSNNGPWVQMFQQAVFAGDVNGAIQKGQQQFEQILATQQ